MWAEIATLGARARSHFPLIAAPSNVDCWLEKRQQELWRDQGVICECKHCGISFLAPFRRSYCSVNHRPQGLPVSAEIAGFMDRMVGAVNTLRGIKAERPDLDFDKCELELNETMDTLGRITKIATTLEMIAPLAHCSDRFNEIAHEMRQAAA